MRRSSLLRHALPFVALLAGCASPKAPAPTMPSVASAGSAAPVRPGAIVTRDYVEKKGALIPENMREKAVGFSKARGWLNVTRTPSESDWKGRVVVVDFWTSCCINCMQTIPTLARLEAKHAHDPVLTVGVHTQKFDAEPEPNRLRAAVIREGITHPVAIDGDRGIWEAWNIAAWPTVLVIDAKGRIAWNEGGEPDEDELDTAIESALAEAKRDALLATTPASFVGRELDVAKTLSFPEKIAPITGGLAIADSGHDRVLLTADDGKLTDIVGSGARGFQDGSFAEARFAHPQGLAEHGDEVFVADTGNHAIRAIDRKKKTVRTVAGTGKIGHERLDGEVDAKAFSMRSPWDLTFIGDTLYVALAGSHQIASLDLARGRLQLVAGSSRENRLDGPLLSASFAQPSGLATDGRDLFVLDSETSSVRRVDLHEKMVHTLVGKALFTWGDVDGEADAVRLQHPIGLSFADGALWVADTYNGKIKRVDPATGATKTIATEGVRLAEPAGLTWKNGTLWIADTNASRLVRVDKGHGKEASIEMGTVSAH